MKDLTYFGFSKRDASFPSQLHLSSPHTLICDFKAKGGGRGPRIVLCRDHATRGSVDGWGLLHSLVADLLKSSLGTASNERGPETQAAKAENWTLVSNHMTNQSKANLLGEELYEVVPQNFESQARQTLSC